MLGKRSALKVVDTEGLVSSPCVQLGLEKGEIVGLEDANKTLRAEQFKGADIVFGSGFSVENGTETKTVGTSEVSDPGPLNVSYHLFLVLLVLDCICGCGCLFVVVGYCLMFPLLRGHASTTKMI